MNMVSREAHPVAVIGAGPVGLAAAAHLAERGLPFVVFESGEGPAAAMAEWGHVTFFSPWRFNVDSAAGRLLAQTGWALAAADLDRDPTARELVERYLTPLAGHRLLVPHIRYSARVTAITRQGMDRVPSRGREGRAFAITVEENGRTARTYLARAVIDASGTWRSPNPAGAAGVAALGEGELGGRISTGIPDVLSKERHRYAGKRVLVIGAGHSAMDSILALQRLKRQEPGTSIIWAMRSVPDNKTFGGGVEDQLASRGALGARARLAVDAGDAQLIAPFRVQAFSRSGDAVTVTSEDGRQSIADQVIVATGFRPDFSWLSEIRLDLHPWLECARELGPLIDPNEHSCGDVPPHGVKELAQPEKDFFIAGIKSYGRAPTFLMATGYEQVRSIVAALAGDLAAAHDTQLVLPQTGVCEGVGHVEADGCCGGPAIANADACCKKDEIAKERGQVGCGCGDTASAAAE